MDLPWVPENFSRVQRDASNPSLVAVATSGEAAQNHFTSGKKKKGRWGGGGDIPARNSKPTLLRGWQISCGLEQI